MYNSKKDRPLVSVVMNCYNCDKFLMDAIDSVYAQTYDNWEIIFWDNSSTDSSADIANSYDNRLKYFQSKVTTKLGLARNQAISRVNGKYVTFLDCDDLHLPDKIEKQVTLMEENSCTMCYGSAYIINTNGEIVDRRKTKNKSGLIFGNLLRHYEINMQSVMILQSVFSSGQFSFSSELSFSPDYDLFMRISSKYHTCVIPDFIVKHRDWGGSLSYKSHNIAALENKFTLDFLLHNSKDLKVKYHKEFIEAYNKLNYYEAIACLYDNDKKNALLRIKDIVFTKPVYLIFYIILLSPISSKNILRLVKN
jgi:glycosyltransferase involved in cell wall biosynthesis